MKAEKKKSNKKRTIIIIAASLLVISAATVTLLWANGVFNPKTEHEESKGVVGVISDDWDDGIEEPTGEKRSGTSIPGYSYAVMKAGDMSLKLRVGNPKENKVGFFAEVKLADGTVLYKSELLKPGQGLEEIPLTQTLEKGEYDALVLYRCVLLDEENTPLNAAESAFTLYVD